MLLYLLLLLLAFSDGQQPSSHLRQGLVFLKQGQLPEAQMELEAAAQVEPDNPYVWPSLAQTYLRLNLAGKAAAAAKKAEKLAAGNAVATRALSIYYSEAALLFLKAEDFDKAAEAANSGLYLQSDEAQLTLALGVARYGQRRFDDAISAFLKVIQIDATLEQPYIFLGKMLDQAGPHLSEITADSESWLAREPQNSKASLLLAKVLLLSDSRSKRAAELLRQSIKLDPDDWESHYELGVLLANQHNYAAAAAELNRSIGLNGKQPMTHYHLARVYDRLGQPDRAQAERETHQRLTNSPAH